MFVHQFDRQTRTHRCTQGVIYLFSLSLSVSVFLCLYVCLSLALFVYLYLSVCLSFCLSVSHKHALIHILFLHTCHCIFVEELVTRFPHIFTILALLWGYTLDGQ